MAERHDIEDYYARSSWIIRWIEAQRVSAIIRLLDVSDRQTVLEVGCGAGHLLGRIMRGRLLGIDLSLRMLDRARRRLNGAVLLVGADAHKLPFLDESFDRILCSEVIEHLSDPVSALIELQRVARPGARIVITVPHERVINGLKSLMNATGLTSLVLGEYHSSRRMDEEWHLHSFNLAEIKALVPAGLEIARVECIPSPLLPVRFVLLLQSTFDRGQKCAFLEL